MKKFDVKCYFLDLYQMRVGIMIQILIQILYYDTKEFTGIMQTERVCLHSQTLSIIAAFLFSLLLRFL